MDLLVALQAAHAFVRGRVAEIKPEDWKLPTPCTEWDVGRIQLHLVLTMEGYDAILTGGFPPELQARIGAIALTPDSAAPTLDEVSERLCMRFAGPGVLSKPVTHPIGPMAGSDLACLSICECCVHSWDLAQAMGIDSAFSEELAQIGYDGALPFIDRVREVGFTKPPETDHPATDSAQARLLHLYGRVP
jgi:uncharacterized protein (TIGR03086 family)